MRVLLALLAVCVSSLPAQERASAVAQFGLASGVEVRLEAVPAAKEIGLFCFVKGGFADDPPGRTGLAHFVEHLAMTAATPERKPGWSALQWARSRAIANAMTRARYTVYFSIGARAEISSDARRFAEVLGGKAEISQSLVDRERVRMIQEIANMTEIRPGAALQWRARALALGGRPEARIGIGLRPEIASLDRDTLHRAYLRTHRPANAFIVVVGHVDPVRDRPFWERVFGEIEAAPMPDPVTPLEPTPTILPVAPHGRAGAPFGVLAIAAPAFDDTDFGAFALGALWLGARANRALRPRGREVEAGLWPSLFAILDEPRVCYFGRRGREGQADEKIVRAELEGFLDRSRDVAKARTLAGALPMLRQQLGHLLVPYQDLESVKEPSRSMLALARVATTRQGLYRAGLSRGIAHVLGFPADLWERIQAASAEDVSRVVRERFDPAKATFVAALPLVKKDARVERPTRRR